MSTIAEIALITLDKDAADMVDNLPGHKVIGFFDKDIHADGGSWSNLGDDSSWKQQLTAFPQMKLLMAADPPGLKKKLIEQFYEQDRICSVYAIDAYIASSASIGRGCLLQRGVRVLPNVKVGDFCKLNSDVVLHHDVRIGDYCTIAPGARLLGKVLLADLVYIGSAATILPGISIGTGATIGAGAVVTRDVPKNTTVIGVPARVV